VSERRYPRRHLPALQRSTRHLPALQRSTRHLPALQRSTLHLPALQRSIGRRCRRVCRCGWVGGCERERARACLHCNAPSGACALHVHRARHHGWMPCDLVLAFCIDSTFPGGMHKEIMRRPGGVKSEEELTRLTNLPAGTPFAPFLSGEARAFRDSWSRVVPLLLSCVASLRARSRVAPAPCPYKTSSYSWLVSSRRRVC